MRIACTRCWLHKSAKTVCMEAMPNLRAPLQVFIDGPTAQDDDFGGYGSSRVSRLLMWMLEKWTLYPEEVGINFTIRCCTSTVKKKVDQKDSIAACSIYSEKAIAAAKSLLGMGDLSSWRLLDSPISRTVYQEHKKARPVPVFMSYSPGYFLQKTAETIDGLRMLHRAAEAAGLKPIYNKDLPLFDFGQI
jgi:uracil-DNA glycosylase